MKIGRLEFLAQLRPYLNSEELKAVEWAYQMSKYGHHGQLRDDGSRYFEHPKECALILVEELRIFDYRMICAILMHDLIEDSFILNHEEIERRLGKKIAEWIDLLTKIDDNVSSDKQSKEVNLLQYETQIMNADHEVKLLKLIDRLHNLRTLNNCTAKKQIRKTEETINFFLPLSKEVNKYLYEKIMEICKEYVVKYPDFFKDQVILKKNSAQTC